jgi:hypothetical protein
MTAFQKAESLATQRYDRDKLLAVVDEVTTHFRMPNSFERSKMRAVCRYLADALDRCSGSTLQQRWNDFEKRFWPKWKSGVDRRGREYWTWGARVLISARMIAPSLAMLSDLRVNQWIAHLPEDHPLAQQQTSLLQVTNQGWWKKAIGAADSWPCGLTRSFHGKYQTGFRFGHGMLGNDNFEVLHFVFQFYGFETYNALINPNNPLARSVLTAMVESGDYFFFALGPNESATAFRSEIEQGNLMMLKKNLARIQGSTTTEAQYNTAIAFFTKTPEPPGPLLHWVCRDAEYLNPAEDRLELTPTS